MNKAYKFAKVHHCAAYDEVKAVFFLDDIAVDALHILEADGLGDGFGYAHLLAYTVDEAELYLGEEYGERYAGESATCAEVEDAGAGAEVDDLGDAEGVEDVVEVEVVNVLAGDDIDFGVPVFVKGLKRGELFTLLGRKGREVRVDFF